MTKISLAILDDILPAQLRERPDEADGLDVVWAGTDLATLFDRAATLRPMVVVAALPLLGDKPDEAVARIVAAAQPEMFITLYSFARRDVVERLSGDKRRVLKGPVSPRMLRAQMMGVIVRSIMSDGHAANSATAQRSATTQRTVVPTPAARAPAVARAPARARESTHAFDDAQLGRLREIRSPLQCECPNHVAELVISLNAFEAYSRDCLNRDDADAKIHAMLYERTIEARKIMEEALTALVRHEKIVV